MANSLTKIVRPGPPGSSTARAYPHVTQVRDAPTQASLRLLWDRVLHAIETQETAGTLVNTLVARVATLETQLTAAQRQLQQAMLIAGKTIATAAPSPSPGDETGGDGGVGDGGGATAESQAVAAATSSGVLNAGTTGHVDAGSPLDGNTAGLIIGGVGNEFPALLAAVVDQATRDTNNETLVGRIIWHLQLAGFAAGKQRNPSQAISKDKLTVQIAGVWYAFDVVPGVSYTVPTTMQAVMVFPADTVADGGIPD